MFFYTVQQVHLHSHLKTTKNYPIDRPLSTLKYQPTLFSFVKSLYLAIFSTLQWNFHFRDPSHFYLKGVFLLCLIIGFGVMGRKSNKFKQSIDPSNPRKDDLTSRCVKISEFFCFLYFTWNWFWCIKNIRNYCFYYFKVQICTVYLRKNVPKFKIQSL